MLFPERNNHQDAQATDKIRVGLLWCYDVASHCRHRPAAVSIDIYRMIRNANARTALYSSTILTGCTHGRIKCPFHTRIPFPLLCLSAVACIKPF